MENSSGVIYDKFIQVKMLILFVMSRLDKPVTLGQLTELTMCDDRISYFDVTECILKLVKSDHLLLADNKYALTAKGLHNCRILEKDLPYSVRVKAEEAAARITAAKKQDNLIRTRRTADENRGFKVELSLSDGVGDILSIELYAANKQQAARLEKGFRRNAKSLYHEVVEVITK